MRGIRLTHVKIASRTLLVVHAYVLIRNRGRSGSLNEGVGPSPRSSERGSSALFRKMKEQFLTNPTLPLFCQEVATYYCLGWKEHGR